MSLVMDGLMAMMVNEVKKFSVSGMIKISSEIT